MGVFSRSWALTKASFRAIGEDKELLIYPILAMIFSIIFIVAMLFPTIIVGFLRESKISPFSVLEYLLIFLVYLGLSFITVFFNVCVVYTAAMRFSGKNATLGSSFKFAFSRIHLIFLWSLVSATVGLLLNLIDRIAQKAGPVGKIILTIVRSILGLIWSIITLFVIPAMVYKNLGPFAAIKESVIVLKKTWGENLVRFLTMTIIEFLFFILGIILFIPLIFIAIPLGVYAIIIVIGIFLFYFLGLALIFSIANQIYNTALYVYATTGKVVGGFDKETMTGAFKNTNQKLGVGL